MDATTIAFLVLLSGTPAEHIIAMPTMADCHRAGETVTQYECLNADQFDERMNNISNAQLQSDIQTASGDTATVPSAPTVAPAEAPAPRVGVPSALKRQAAKALYPSPLPHPSYPATRLNEGSSLSTNSLMRAVAYNR